MVVRPQVEVAHVISRIIDVMRCRVPLVFTPQPEGGYTVTSPLLPELVTEGDSLDDASANVPDALIAVFELYSESDRPLPPGLDSPEAR